MPINIYHITHINNLASILNSGGLMAKSKLRPERINYLDIAYERIQDRRARTRVPCGAGGVLQDYVPFYFAPRSPMLYAIHKGNVEGYAQGQNPVIHLVSEAEAIEASGLAFAFTDGHVVMAYADFYDDLDVVEEVQQLGISSIAIPPLGCGNGGLNWAEVKPLIESAFAQLPNVQVVVFEPIGAPVVDKMQVATPQPKMTRSRSLLIRLLEVYGIPGYRLTLLEVQKLAYFLQVAGEPLKLRYVKHKYGPYADNLNHALQRIEGHYIRGYGDRSSDAQIYVLPEGREAAQTFLEKEPDANKRLERVSSLITGFETPYGMEMLATVHWVTQEDPKVAKDSEQAIALVHGWSERKRKLFKPEHIRKAWQRLHKQNWLAPREIP